MDELINSTVTFKTKAAAGFSGVPMRTVQYWADSGLLNMPTSGPGDRREFTVLNCIEIAIIASARKEKIGYPLIKKMMIEHRKNNRLRILLEHEYAFITNLIDDDDPGRNKSEGMGLNKGERSSWKHAARPDYHKTLNINVRRIADKVLRKIEAHEG